MIMKSYSTKRVHFIASFMLSCLLLLLLIVACNKVIYEDYTYGTFYSRAPDPPFSFEYPSNYSIGYEPFSSDSVLVEMVGRRDSLLPMIHVDASRIGKWEEMGLDSPEAILEDHLQGMSSIKGVTDFKILDQSIVHVSGIEAQYVTYSYTQKSDKAGGKYTVFNSSNFTWIIYAVYDEHEMEEIEKVFKRLLDTFQFLD